jgi:hypothetical protein
MRLYIYIFTIFVITSTSCNDEIPIDIPVGEKYIVVDGWIENGDYPRVLLTWSSPYFSELDSASIRDQVIKNAKVTVTCGETSEVLILVVNNNFFPPYMYQGLTMRGEIGKKYDLKVEYKGNTITASTTIPKTAYLDSIWFQRKNNNDTLGYIYGRITDNADEKNYYKTYAQIIGKNKKYVPTLISNYDDVYFNGKQFTFKLYQGPESYLNPDVDVYFHVDDTIKVRISSLDENAFKFWESYQREVVNSGNPFASSYQEVYSNVQEPGFGVWFGYSASYYMVIAK